MLRANLPASIFVLFFTATLSFFAQESYAKDLGVIGTTFPVAETDLLQLLENRAEAMVKNGQWVAIQKQINQQTQQQLDRPKPVANISRTLQPKSFLFDPTVISPATGKPLNPLDSVPFNETWLFYNADDPDQIAWVQAEDKKLKGHDKLILINGSVQAQQQLFQKPVYFDQQGFITFRLGITQVPAVVTQEGDRLRVQEVMP